MIKNIVSKYAEQIVVLLLTTLSVIIAKSVYNFLLIPLLVADKGKIIIQISALLLGLLLVSLSYIFYLYLYKIRPKSKIENEYTFNENTGIYTHNKTGKLFCGTCMLEGVESPLITLAYGWFCQHKGCSKSYSDPDNPRPKPQRKVISRGIDSYANKYKRW